MERRVAIVPESALIEHWDESPETLGALLFDPARSRETIQARWNGNHLPAGRPRATTHRREGGGECRKDQETAHHLDRDACIRRTLQRSRQASPIRMRL